MTEQTTDELLRPAGPLPSAERIAAIDVLRGVAVLGILVINIEAFGLPHADKSAPGTEWVGVYLPTLSRLNLALWTISRALFDGKMRAIFSMLFGAGVVLLTSRLERRGQGAHVADIYYRRTLWLLAFGVLHAYLLWEGDILYSYAVSGLFLFPFRRLSARALVVSGALILALAVPRAAFTATHRHDLREQAARADAAEAAGREPGQTESAARDEWQEIMESFEPDARTVRDSQDAYRGGYGRLFARRAPLVVYVESSDYYGWAFFDTVGMMLIGMGLLKLGVLTASRSRRFYVTMLVAGFGLGLPLSAAASYQQYAHRFDPVAVVWGTVAYHPGRLGVALAHIAAVMLVVKAWPRALTGSLGDVGRMALSNYLAATVVCTTLFNGYGFGLFGSLRRVQLYTIVLGVWCAQLIGSRVWLGRFRFGPAEWAWRSLTYWKVQPLRRGARSVGLRSDALAD